MPSKWVKAKTAADCPCVSACTVSASTHALELPLLEHAEELGLGGERHVADLVEQERAAVGLFEQARLAALAGAGEGAVHVAEQDRLDQLGGHGRTVDGDERLMRPGAAAVDRLGEELLAGPRLPEDPDRRVAGRGPAGQVKRSLHSPALGDDVGPGVPDRLAASGFLNPPLVPGRRPVVAEAQAELPGDRDPHGAGPRGMVHGTDVGPAGLHHLPTGGVQRPQGCGIGAAVGQYAHQVAALPVEDQRLAPCHLGNQRQGGLEGGSQLRLPGHAVPVGGRQDILSQGQGPGVRTGVALGRAQQGLAGEGRPLAEFMHHALFRGQLAPLMVHRHDAHAAAVRHQRAAAGAVGDQRQRCDQRS